MLVVQVGNNIQPGQRLVIRAPLEAAPLVRLVARKAYQVGASLVDVQWSDDLTTLERLQHSQEAFLSEISESAFRVGDETVERGDAFLAILANDPAVYANAEPSRVATMIKAVGARSKKRLEAFGAGMVNWSIVPYAVPSWANKVFPHESPEVALEKLWNAVFMVTRADQADPVTAWKTHLHDLEARRDFLNTQKLRRLEFRAPGTDLQIELPELHRWEGGSGRTSNPRHGQSITYVPNIPTEEVFTMPHRFGVNGTVRATRSLGYSGQIIDGIAMTFKDGKAVAASATTNEATLHQLLASDEGAKHLGEVALVAESSPVARSGLLFHETLFDENAACHIAMGRAYAYTLHNGTAMNPAQLLENGANDSQVHVDWMIGSKDMDVVGIRADGTKLELLSAGQWAFTV